MIKSISFCKEFIPLIKSGKKTVTRRLKFTGNPGDIYWFKIGRNGKKKGYIKILNVSLSTLKMINIPYRGEDESIEYNREGFYNPMSYMLDFKKLWDSLNPIGYKWWNNPDVYRIEFKYLGENKGVD